MNDFLGRGDEIYSVSGTDSESKQKREEAFSLEKSERHEVQGFGQFMKLIFAMLTIGFLVLSTGCAATPTSFDQALSLIDKAAEIAERQGTAYTATVRWDGTLGGAWIQRLELDSGVTVEVNFHGNAAAERAAVKKTDP